MSDVKNILELKQFYDSAKGHNTCRIIRKIISNHWRFAVNETIAGYGFALPYLPILAERNKLIAFCPAQMGAMSIEQNIAVALIEENLLPLKNESLERILLIHAIESCQNPDELFAEFWRVLKPYGRVLIFAENKKVFPESIVAKLRANKFNITLSRKCVVSENIPILEFLSGIYGKYQVIEAQKLIFAPRGRTQKVTKNLLDKLLRPKPKLKPV